MLHNHFYRSGGSAIVIRRICESMPAGTVEFIFAGCGHELPGSSECVEDLAWMPPGSYRSFNLMAKSPKLIGELSRFSSWLRESSCDIIHVHHRRLAVLANLLSTFTRIPVLFTAHVTHPDEAWFRWLSPANATAVSTSVMEYLHRSTRVTAGTLIWNPYHFPSAPRETTRRFRRVINIGRLEPVKGHVNLIEAWRLLLDGGTDATLDIFGEGYLRPQLETLVAVRGLGAHIRFKGFSSDIHKEIKASAFHVLVSEREGFPNAVVEAAAEYIPTLLTDVDGSRDTLPAGHVLPNGIPYGDVERLADALRIWITSPDDVRRDGALFRDYLRAQCSPDVVRDQYVNLYSQLLDVAFVAKERR
jgi:glycosyltransferase involved in cell wall biosynthesis